MKKFLPIFLILPIFLSFNAFGQTAAIGDYSDFPGQQIVVPVVVTDFYNVGGITLFIDFDPDVLDYISFNNPSGLPNLLVNAFNPGGGRYTVGITLSTTDPINIAAGTLLELVFFYNGGETGLDFFEGLGGCEIVTIDDQQLSVTYGNGSITQLSSAIVNIPDQLNMSPGNLSVPIEVDFSEVNLGVGSFTFEIVFDEANLTYQSITPVGISSGFLINTLSGPNRLAIQWVNPDFPSGGSNLNGTMLTINFDYLGGNTSLEFLNTNCIMSDNEAESVSVYYSDGLITQDLSEAIVISLPHIEANPGTTVNLPLSGTNLENIGSFEFHIAFNATALDFVGLDNIHNSLSEDDFILNEIGGVVLISWINFSNPITLADATLFDLVFNFSGGDSQFIFDRQQSELADASTTEPQNAFYQDGSIAEIIAFDGVITIPHALATPGAQAIVPVYATGLNNLGAINLAIEYNPTVLTTPGVINVNPLLLNNGSFSANYAFGVLYFEWVVNPELLNNGPDIPEGAELFEMQFNFPGGTSALEFNTAECEISQADIDISPIIVSYINGSVIGGIVSLELSTITANPSQIALGETSDITVQLKDPLGDNLTASGGTVLLSTTAGTLSAVTDNNNGTYSATLTGSGPGVATITGTLNAAPFTDTEEVVIMEEFFTVRVFLEGLYKGGRIMRRAQQLVENQLVDRFTPPVAEQITVQFHVPGSYGVTFYSVTNVNLNEDGYAEVSLPSGMPLNAPYYLTIRTRNHLETVSATTINPITVSEYDFTTAANKAYGSKQKFIENYEGQDIFVTFAGDTDQNGLININDAGPINAGIILGTRGYLTEDVNGDGILNINDAGPVNANISNGITSVIPN